jgi:hypothetical protein
VVHRVPPVPLALQVPVSAPSPKSLWAWLRSKWVVCPAVAGREEGDNSAAGDYSQRMFRLTRSEQLLVAGLSLALVVGAVVKRIRDNISEPISENHPASQVESK